MTKVYYTSFSSVYEMFYSKITDDMYMEYTEEDTAALAQNLLISAIPKFEFARTPLIYTLNHHQETDKDGNVYEVGAFKGRLNLEEVNILATYMIVEWLGQQLASIELTRMKYSGSDFKFTSQANHMQKLLQMKKDYEREGFHLQRLYKRRFRDINGIYHSTFGKIMEPVASLPTKAMEEDREDYVPDNYMDTQSDNEDWIADGIAWNPFAPNSNQGG